MKQIKYKQCLLKKKETTKTSWIPDKFAIKGKFLKFHDDDGWEVKEVYSIMLDGDVVNSNSQDYKRTRKASDI